MADTENNQNPEDIAKLREENERLLKTLVGLVKSGKDFDSGLFNWTKTVEQSEKQLRETLGKQFRSSVVGFSNSLYTAGKQAIVAGDAIQAAQDLMIGQISVFNQTVQQGATALTEYGKSLAAAGEKSGTTIMNVGKVLGVVANVITDLTQTGIKFMITQTNKLVDGFKQMSSAGAVYSDGLAGMTKTALDSGMTLEQFSKAIVDNKDALLLSGLGITEGSKKLAAAMKAGGQAARDGMFGLGMTMDEQASAYATVIARMTGPMGRLHASDAEVAARTEEYARNLKLISDITGKTAREQEAQAEAATNTFRMQQELAKMGKDGEKLKEALGGMDAAAQKALIDRYTNHGVALDKTTNILETVSPSLKAYHEEQYQLAQQGKLNGESEAKLHQKYAESINKELSSHEALAQASAQAGSSIGEINAAGADIMKENAKLIGVNIDAEKERVKKAQDAGKAAEKGSAAWMMETQQTIATKLQDIALKNLPAFADALDAAIAQIKGAVDVMANGGSWLAQALTGWGAVFATVVGTALTSWLTSKALSKGAGLAANVGATEGLAAGAPSSIRNKMRSLRGLEPIAGREAGVIKRSPIAGSELSKDLGIAGREAGVIKRSPIAGSELSKDLGNTGKGVQGFLSGLAKGAGDIIENVLGGLGRGLQSLGNPRAMLGVVTLGLIGGALWVGAKGFKEFAGVKWDDAFIGVGVLTGLAAAAALAAPAAIPMMLTAAALGVLGGSLWIMGQGIKELENSGGSASELVKLGEGIKGFVSNLPYMQMGIAAPGMTVFGLALLPFGLGLSSMPTDPNLGTVLTGTGQGIKNFMDSLPYVQMIPAAAGISAFGLSLIPFGLGLSSMPIDPNLGTVLTGTGQGIKNFMDSLPYVQMIPAAAGISAFGLSLIPFSQGIKTLPGDSNAGSVLTNLGQGVKNFIENLPGWISMQSASSSIKTLSESGIPGLTDQLTGVEQLDPVKLSSVAKSIGDIVANLPSAADLAKLAAIQALEKAGIIGDSTKEKTTSTGTSTTTDSMSELVSLTKQTIVNQKEMLGYLRDNVDTGKKIHTALM